LVVCRAALGFLQFVGVGLLHGRFDHDEDRHDSAKNLR